MPANDPDAKAEELKRLFDELRVAYARASEAVPEPLALANESAHSRFAEENRKISALIERIRVLQGL